MKSKWLVTPLWSLIVKNSELVVFGRSYLLHSTIPVYVLTPTDEAARYASSKYMESRHENYNLKLAHCLADENVISLILTKRQSSCDWCIKLQTIYMQEPIWCQNKADVYRYSHNVYMCWMCTSECVQNIFKHLDIAKLILNVNESHDVRLCHLCLPMCRATIRPWNVHLRLTC